MSQAARSSLRLYWPMGLLLACVVGFLAAVRPGYAAVVAVVIPLVLIARTPFGRLGIFALGGVAVFGREGSVNAPKLAYLAVVLVFSVVSYSRITRGSAQLSPNTRRTTTRALGLMCLVIAWAAAIGFGRGAALIDVVRDATTYVLIAASIPIGIEAGITTRRSRIRNLGTVTAVVAAVSFAVSVSAARGVSLVSSDKVLLASVAAVALGVSLACAEAFAGRPVSLRWAFVAVLLVVAVLVSGTRTGILLWACFLTTMLAGQRLRIGSVFKASVLLMVVPLVSVVLLFAVGPNLVDQEFLTRRAESVGQLLGGNYAQDSSLVSRQSNYAIARSYMEHSILAGEGFGRVSGYGYGARPAGASYYIDTPLLYPAKFGLFGSMVLVLSLYLAIVKLTPARGAMGEARRARAAALAFGSYFVVVLPLAATTEDKGFALAIGVLAAHSVAARTAADEA